MNRRGPGSGSEGEILVRKVGGKSPGRWLLGVVAESQSEVRSGDLPQPTNVSRTVAQHAATQSGLDPSLLRKMLPMLAMLVAGYMAKQHSSAAAPPTGGGGLGGLLGGMLGGQAAGGGVAPGLASILDLDGDGNPLDDILVMAGKMMR